MRTIEVLDRTTIDKIAAGEVVERPASVVKELVENAIDADSTAITVEIREGGCSLIRITDNGCGIPAEEVKKAFLRHATSKIRKVEDLTLIASLGFRGEALSSISAVAQVELITKTPEALTGIRYCIEGGNETEFEEVGAPQGSTFLIRNLFYNVPARAKFLKSAMTEGNHVTAVVEQLALSHPDISFKYLVNGQSKLYTSGNGNLQEVIYQVFGREIAKELIPFQAESEQLTIKGFLGKPVIARGNRNFENYYVNGRYVKSKLIAKAIEDGYHGFMMQHRYPFTLLYLEVNSDKVDVNVHPAKMEVRFSDQESLYHQLCQGIKNALMHREHIPEVSLGSRSSERQQEQQKKALPPEPFETQRRTLQSSHGVPTFAKPSTAPSSRKDEGTKAAEQRPSFLRRSGYQETLPENLTLKERGESLREAGSVFHEPEASLRKTEDPPSDKTATVQGSNSMSDLKTADISYKGEIDAAAADSAHTNVQTPATDSAQRNAQSASARDSAQVNSQIPASADSAQMNSQTVASAEFSSHSGSNTLPADQTEPIPQEEVSGQQMELFDGVLLTEKEKSSHRIIGQLFETYWLVEFDQSLYIIDQHAAHEKVLYERLVKSYENRSVASQMVSPPAVISLSSQEIELLEKYKDVFASMGYELEHFGGKEYKICAVPSELYRVSAEQLLREIMDQLSQMGEKRPEAISERLASMSCKAAVKGNNRLSIQEAEALIEELLTLENPYHCPHGRPTIISMTKYELEKKFKRII